MSAQFRLSQDFLKNYIGKHPLWGPLGYVVFKRTYARPKLEGGTEEYWETVKRVVEGCYTIQKKHCQLIKVDWNEEKAQESAREMFRLMWEFKFLPPGRGLWSMGTPIIEEKGGAALNNCGFISTSEIDKDFSYPFCWMMDMLMLGVGVGFDALGAGKVTIGQPVETDEPFVVEDTREGWVDLVRTVLRAYAEGAGQRGHFLPKVIDYSKVRPKGSPIKTFGGTASGPEPLDLLVQDINKVLSALIGKKITVTAINDIFNLVGRCVVAGNVRRSAQISLGDALDGEFLNLKNPEINQERLNSHGWAANNSILATVGMDYSTIAPLIALNGEPGCVWLDNARLFSRMGLEADYKDHLCKGTNPCGEQTLESGELCNLVETFPVNHETYEEYANTLKYAYLYSKTVTLIPTFFPKTNAIMQRNRRIGCSMSGIVQAMNKFGRRNFFNWCKKGYKDLQKLDVKYSDWLCIPVSKKMTSIKPSGTVSLLPGVTPGVHYPHSEYYIRRIRFQEDSPFLKELEESGYPVEKDFYSMNTKVVSFPIKEKYYSRSKEDVSMWEQLEMAAQLQHYWADNQVSITVTFNKEEAKDLQYALELYETRLKSVSFLPMEDHGYQQPPYETITEDLYNELVSKLKPLSSLDTSVHEVQEKFCDSDVCMIG